MTECPILFSAPMVRAILAGTKTQTRRVMKPRRDRDVGCELACNELAGEVNGGRYRNAPWQPGDRLWVKETTLKVEDHGYLGPVYAESEEGRACLSGGLAPSEDDCTEVDPWEIKRRPSIFMPRSMARIHLEVVGVRVERLQDIGEADAIAEGIERVEDFFGCPCWKAYGEPAGSDVVFPDDPIGSYASLWTSINGPGSWDANPWVWAIEFRRIAP